MKRNLVISLAGALCFAFVAVVAAQMDSPTPQENQGAPMGHFEVGTVVTVSSSSLVIITTDGMQMTFQGDPSSRIPPGLKAGDKVRVNYADNPDGVHRVTEVSLDAAATPAPVETVNDPTVTGNRAATDAGTLPATASPIPLLGAAGLLALSGMLGLRLLRR